MLVQIARVLVSLAHIIQIPVSIPFAATIRIIDCVLAVIYQGAIPVCAYHFINHFYLEFFCVAVEQARDELKQTTMATSAEAGQEIRPSSDGMRRAGDEGGEMQVRKQRALDGKSSWEGAPELGVTPKDTVSLSACAIRLM